MDKNQQGFAHIFLILLLLIGMGVGVYLITSGNPLKLFSKASSDPVSFEGPTVTYQNNQYYTTSLTGVKLKLTSPVIAPARTATTVTSTQISTAAPAATAAHTAASTQSPTSVPTAAATQTSTPTSFRPPAHNLLVNGDLESNSINPWQRFRPADLTSDQSLISTHETNWSIINNSQQAVSGNYYLAINCGNFTFCIPGQNIYQDIDASNISAGTAIGYGGKFSTAAGNGSLALVVFELGSSGQIIQQHRTNLTVTPPYQLFHESFTLNSQVKTLRYVIYLNSTNTFNLDEMFLGYGDVQGAVYAASYYTVSYKWGKSPQERDAAAPQSYTAEPILIDYAFSSTAPGTSETVFVEFIGSGGEKEQKQATITYKTSSDNRSLESVTGGSSANPAGDNFDVNLNAWGNLSDASSANNVSVDGTHTYKGSGALKIHYTDGTHAVKLEKTFTSTTNIVARTFFYDDMNPTAGTTFSLKDNSGNYTAIGLKTDEIANDYMIRINAASYDTYFPRSLGWHMFEIIVTPQGAYGKVDNYLVRKDDDRQNPMHGDIRVAIAQTSASIVDFVSTWGLTGDSYYDQLSITSMDQKSWQDQMNSILETYYANWNDVSIAPLINRNGALTKADNNALRMIFETAMSLSAYGQLTNNSEAKQKGANIFSRVINNADWNLDNHPVNVFPQGATQAEMVYAAYSVWDQLSTADKSKFLVILHSQAANFIDEIKGNNIGVNLPLSNSIDHPTSEHPDPIQDTKAEENGAAADFLAAAVNLFPDAFSAAERSRIDTEARCIAYYTISRPSDQHPSFDLGNGQICGGGNIYSITDDWRLGNHGNLSGPYALAPIYQLGRSAQTYHLAGREIPAEFKHNVKELYDHFLKPRIDTNTYQFINSQRDWCCGTTDSSYDGTLAVKYLESLGADLGFSINDYFNKRSLFFRDITTEWLKNTKPSSITDMYNWILRPKGQNGASRDFAVTEFKRFGIVPQPGREQEDADAYNYFMDANMASINALTALFFTPLAPPADRLSAWQAALPVGSTLAVSSPTSGSSTNPYDLNNDGKVNSLDVSIFLADWDKAKTGNLNPRSDFNKDGAINNMDYSLLIKHLGI